MAVFLIQYCSRPRYETRRTLYIERAQKLTISIAVSLHHNRVTSDYSVEIIMYTTYLICKCYLEFFVTYFVAGGL